MMWGIYRYTLGDNELVQVVVGSEWDADQVCKGWNHADMSNNYYTSWIGS